MTAPGVGGGFHPEPATTSHTVVQEDTMTSTLTRRPALAPTAGAAALARHIVRATTRTAPQAWTTAEERLADDVAELTGTDPQLWAISDYEGTATIRRLINQGADAILGTAPAELVEPTEPGCDFAEMEAEIANEAATDAATEAAAATRTRIDKRAGRREQIRAAALQHYTEAELAAFGDDPLDAWGKDVRDVVERWSPFRADRSGQDPRGRYVIRCKDGSRRYPDGSLAH
ncbi:hypothetical protein [Kitasatospora cineracea]|uniref:hypothetical protein n=1 Tax=Kitasatospora cineracea TaxID=88074 RepID=UPI003686A70C